MASCAPKSLSSASSVDIGSARTTCRPRARPVQKLSAGAAAIRPLAFWLRMGPCGHGREGSRLPAFMTLADCMKFVLAPYAASVATSVTCRQPVASCLFLNVASHPRVQQIANIDPQKLQRCKVSFDVRSPSADSRAIGALLYEPLSPLNSLHTLRRCSPDTPTAAPSGEHLFDRGHVFIETACLLASSFTCGTMMIALDRRSLVGTYLCALLTAVLGVTFLSFELSEFIAMVYQGAGPSRSAFLSSFFALVGTHGMHVGIGIAWLIVMVAQLATLGFGTIVMTRMLCFSLFWHALDIVWIGVFTIVYLGASG